MPGKVFTMTKHGEPMRYLREVVMPYEGNECSPWPYSRDTQGYGTIWHDGRSELVSRLVCKLDKGEPPTPEHQAAHGCGKGHLSCCTKRHLSWKTRAGNAADTIIHGTDNRGERNGIAKLTESDVREIRALKGRVIQREIAQRFGVTKAAVSMIHIGRNWRHVS